MRIDGHKVSSTEDKIDAIAITSDRLTGRGGLVLFSRYLSSIKINPHLDRLFGSMRRSGKGLPVRALFKQLFCFLLDGTSRHLVYFDELKRDSGYAGTIETTPSAMASSHQVKRFFARFSWHRIWLFRRLLQQLFLWRLHIDNPDVIVVGVDTMVMDNSESDVRHGVEPTYKQGVKGFQPLHVTWGRYLIDAVFRGGSKHSNHGKTVSKTLGHLVRLIRTRYRAGVPIIVRMDAGFFDQKLMEYLESLSVGYIISGKLYRDVVEQASSAPEDAWLAYRNDHQQWQYLEMTDRRGTWKHSRRAIYCRTLIENNGQRVMDFAGQNSILYTNLDPGTEFGKKLKEAGYAHFIEAKSIIRHHHDRGCDELVHRALKEFRAEALPFKRFTANAAFYHVMLLAFFLYEAFKEDVCGDVLPISSYVTRMRRRVIDIAAKIVRSGGRTILKVTAATHRALDLKTMWDRAARPPTFAWR
ncbi:MAG: IS1380 family transposase [Pirellulaceae bacterium]